MIWKIIFKYVKIHTVMNYTNILFESDESVAVITVNRPDAMNALNPKTLEELEQAFLNVRGDEKIKASILTGAGGKSFIAGADIKDLAVEKTLEERQSWLRKIHGVFALIETSTKPVIAAVNGYALGGGCEIAMACHLRIASEKASFGQPEINLGIIPGYGGTQRLPRLVGKGVAIEMMLTGKRIDAREAYRIGLVNVVVPPEDLMKEAKELARKIAEKSSMAIKYILDAVTRGAEMPLDYALFLEADLAALCFNAEDAKEGIAAFIEKRKPDFKGR